MGTIGIAGGARLNAARTFSRRDVAVLQKESLPFRAREDVNPQN